MYIFTALIPSVQQQTCHAHQSSLSCTSYCFHPLISSIGFFFCHVLDGCYALVSVTHMFPIKSQPETGEGVCAFDWNYQDNWQMGGKAQFSVMANTVNSIFNIGPSTAQGLENDIWLHRAPADTLQSKRVLLPAMSLWCEADSSPGESSSLFCLACRVQMSQEIPRMAHKSF